MKILFLTNNDNTISLVKWLKKIGEKVYIHSKKITISEVKKREYEFIISYNYKYLIPENIIEFLPNRIINLHISYLPWNKGVSPNIWSFIDDSPKGVTIHLIDKGIDTGPILLQKKVAIDENNHTLKSSYELLQKEVQKLFTQNWYKIKSKKIKPRQQQQKGSIHNIGDYVKISPLIEGDWDISIKELKRIYKK